MIYTVEVHANTADEAFAEVNALLVEYVGESPDSMNASTWENHWGKACDHDDPRPIWTVEYSDSNFAPVLERASDPDLRLQVFND